MGVIEARSPSTSKRKLDQFMKRIRITWLALIVGDWTHWPRTVPVPVPQLYLSHDWFTVWKEYFFISDLKFYHSSILLTIPCSSIIKHNECTVSVSFIILCTCIMSLLIRMVSQVTILGFQFLFMWKFFMSLIIFMYIWTSSNYSAFVCTNTTFTKRNL